MRFARVLSMLLLIPLCSSCRIQGVEHPRYAVTVTDTQMNFLHTRDAIDVVAMHLDDLKSFQHTILKMHQTPIELNAKMDKDQIGSIGILVNKFHELPLDYRPDDLVYPNAPFIFDERVDKRKMRKEAAHALEQLIAGARKDGIYLAGVSAYRSHAAQTAIYHSNVRRYGKKNAELYCAEPGHSEHKTGLAVDLTRSDGRCAAEACFADMKEAQWLQYHAHEYGYIVRYPKGKEHITGYQYEPWHIRYVGKQLSALLTERRITLEEYYESSYSYWPVLDNG